MVLKIGSLFSGYGGLDLAVEAVTGGETVWVCDPDDGPRTVLEARFGVPNLGDVTQVDWGSVEPVDVLTGGSPCQDLSNAGRRAGMTEGTRSNLWVNMRLAISALRPRLVIWENVQGALSAKASSESDVEPGTGPLGEGRGGSNLRALGRVLGDLTEMGYDARWATVRASDIGAPHHRARVFLVACPRREHGDPWSIDFQEQDSTLRSPETDQTERHPEPATDTEDNGLEELYDSTIRDEACGGRLREPAGSARCEASADSGGFGLETGRGQPQPEEPALTGPDIGEQVVSGGVRWGEYEPAIRRWEQVVGPAPGPVEPNTKGRPRLSARFAEWMMGLPAGWVTSPELGLSRTKQLKIIGNGVVPQQAEAALRMLLQEEQWQ